MKKISNLFKNKKEFILFFSSLVFALIFFIWQRQFFSWDFYVYVMNGQFPNGIYFEWLRPPLVPFLLGIFMLLGKTAGQYIFIIFSTTLYFFTLKTFHDRFLKEKKYSEIFYLLAINPFILIYGLGMGTELISLSLIILFVTFAFSYKSYLFLGLAMLARYSNFILFPLIFLSVNWKKIILGILILFVTFLPWFIFNYVNTGHVLTSIGDYYTLNSLEQARASPDFGKLGLHLLISLNFLIPLILFGIFYFIKYEKIKKDHKKLGIILIVFSFLVLLTYELNTYKDQRFLFNLLFPAIYFSMLGFNYLLEKKNLPWKKIIFVLIFITMIVSSIFSFVFMSIGNTDFIREDNKIKEISSKLGEMENNCTISSDLWVYFNWYGEKARPEPKWRPTIKDGLPEIYSMVEEGYNIILFKNSEAYEVNKNFTRNLSQYIFEDTEQYIWLKNNESCKLDDKIESNYFKSMKIVGEFPEDFTGCDALFLRFGLRDICRKFSFL